MGEAMFPSVSFATANGQQLDLDGEATGDDTVESIRDRVATALGVHPQQISMHSGYAEEELLDGCTMAAALEGDPATTDTADISITVIVHPCRVRPEQYETYIDRGSTGFIDVDYIRYEMFHPVRFRRIGDEERRVPIPEPKHDVEPICFPPPQDININMMPFIMGDVESLPEFCRQYWGVIERCQLLSSEKGKVGYLTVQEGWVPAGQSQRRPGLHIESPGGRTIGGVHRELRINWGACGAILQDQSFVAGGLYMATNVPNSCRLWDVRVRDSILLAGRLGDVEHIREHLGEGTIAQPGTMYWLTDATPHESLPLEEGAYRQFFRLVTSKLSLWYPQHSTANPLGIEPDPAITQIVDSSKF